MKKLTSIIAVCLCLIMALSLIGCGGGGNIKGSWKTRPQVDENGEVIEIPAEDVQLFEFSASGTGNMSLPEFGETVVISFNWKTSGNTLTLTAGESEVHKFKYKVKDHVLYLTREGSDKTFEYIKVS